MSVVLGSIALACFLSLLLVSILSLQAFERQERRYSRLLSRYVALK